MPGASPTTLVVRDLAGIFVFATGLGGGFVRDVRIGATPPVALADRRHLLVPTARAGRSRDRAGLECADTPWTSVGPVERTSVATASVTQHPA